MKKLFSVLLSFVLVAVSFFGSPALAADLANGAKVFGANCAACHLGGGNLVVGSKTLKQDVLKANGMDSEEAIVTQVTNAKSAIPNLGGKLDREQIADVAAYVLDKSAKGW